jgi:hypothetical protein
MKNEWIVAYSLTVAASVAPAAQQRHLTRWGFESPSEPSGS